MGLEAGVIIFCLVCGIVAVVYGGLMTRWVLRQKPGSERMQEVGRAIQEGAQAFLNRQYKAIGLVGLVILVILMFALGLRTALGFLIGALLSSAAGYIGMYVSVRANMRTAEAAREGLAPALKVAFRGGSITGLLVVGFGLIGVVGYYALLRIFEPAGGTQLMNVLMPLAGLGFGGSLHFRPARRRDLYQGGGCRGRLGWEAGGRDPGG